MNSSAVEAAVRLPVGRDRLWILFLPAILFWGLTVVATDAICGKEAGRTA